MRKQVNTMRTIKQGAKWQYGISSHLLDDSPAATPQPVNRSSLSNRYEAHRYHCCIGSPISCGRHAYLES